MDIYIAYKTLSVDAHMTLKDISKVYKKLALKYHPDKNNNEKQFTVLFQKLQQAYSYICDNHVYIPERKFKPKSFKKKKFYYEDDDSMPQPTDSSWDIPKEFFANDFYDYFEAEKPKDKKPDSSWDIPKEFFANDFYDYFEAEKPKDKKPDSSWDFPKDFFANDFYDYFEAEKPKDKKPDSSWDFPKDKKKSESPKAKYNRFPCINFNANMEEISSLYTIKDINLQAKDLNIKIPYNFRKKILRFEYLLKTSRGKITPPDHLKKTHPKEYTSILNFYSKFN